MLKRIADSVKNELEVITFRHTIDLNIQMKIWQWWKMHQSRHTLEVYNIQTNILTMKKNCLIKDVLPWRRNFKNFIERMCKWIRIYRKWTKDLKWSWIWISSTRFNLFKVNIPPPQSLQILMKQERNDMEDK